MSSLSTVFCTFTRCCWRFWSRSAGWFGKCWDTDICMRRTALCCRFCCPEFGSGRTWRSSASSWCGTSSSGCKHCSWWMLKSCCRRISCLLPFLSCAMKKVYYWDGGVFIFLSIIQYFLYYWIFAMTFGEDIYGSEMQQPSCMHILLHFPTLPLSACMTQGLTSKVKRLHRKQSIKQRKVPVLKQTGTGNKETGSWEKVRWLAAVGRGRQGNYRVNRSGRVKNKRRINAGRKQADMNDEMEAEMNECRRALQNLGQWDADTAYLTGWYKKKIGYIFTTGLKILDLNVSCIL